MTTEVQGQDAIPESIVAEELPPHLKGRVKGLIYDLRHDGLPMALLDLAHLYRALRSEDTRRTLEDEPLELTDDARTLIFSNDRAAIEEICMGPDQRGKCPRAEEGHPVACAEKWIMNKGWNFKVAPDAEACPLVSLGLAHQYFAPPSPARKTRLDMNVWSTDRPFGRGSRGLRPAVSHEMRTDSKLG